MDYKVLFGLFLGLLAYSCLYLAKGIEKYAIEGIKEVRTVKSKHSLIWILGVCLNTIYMFMQWAALKFSPISLIAPLNGVGLVVLLIFCFYVLKEKIGKIEVFGAVLIVLGIIVISIFSSDNIIIDPYKFNLQAYLFFTITIAVCEILVIFISKIKRLKYTGIIVGFTAGTFFAFETVSKRITALPDDNIKILCSVLTMFISLIGFVFTQYALVKEKANLAVPCFTSISIIFATAIGMAFLHEGLNIWSILGMGVLLSGISLMTAFKGDTPFMAYIKNQEIKSI